jgi:hypothetical protein
MRDSGRIGRHAEGHLQLSLLRVVLSLAALDWLSAEPAGAVLARLRAADSSPGVLDVIGGAEYYLVGGHEEDDLPR